MTTPDGQLEQHDGRWQLRFTRRLAHPQGTVWRAVTEPEHLRAWFPFDVEGERAAGAPLRFVFRDGEGEPFDGRMLAFDPPSVMELGWGNDETLRIEVAPAAGGSVLTLVNAFGELGKAARDAAGWHACLDALGHELDGEPPPARPRERWEQVHEAYLERFGPEAGTIGPPG